MPRGRALVGPRRPAYNRSVPETIPVATTVSEEPVVDPVVEVYKQHVDLTLIREQLRRSIDERIDRMTAALRLAEELRAAGRRG